LKALGIPVVCIDARHAKAALQMQLNKTDENDAQGLAQIMRTGWFRAVHVKSWDSQLLRSLLQSRLQLVNMCRDASNQVRGTLKVFGIVLPTGRRTHFDRLARERISDRVELQCFIEPLLAAWRALNEQVKGLDKQLAQIARSHPIVRNLMSAPGVGAVIGVAYLATIDDAGRFAKSRNVAAHLGLSPRRFQSGEVDRQGSISKSGDSLMRHYLYEAATVLMSRTRRYSALQAWGSKLSQRIGPKKAKVAVARKLAVILHQMWKSGQAFRWGSPAEVSA
jgi:transposase